MGMILRQPLQRRAAHPVRLRCAGLLVCGERRLTCTPVSLVAGIQKVLDERDVVVSLGGLPVNQPVSHSSLPKLLREGLAEGLLIHYSHPLPPTLLRAVATCGISAIWMNCKLSNDCVYPDDRGAAGAVVLGMLGRGHRRIAYLEDASASAGGERHYSAFDRLAGYSEAVTAAGLKTQIVQPPAGGSEAERLNYLRAWLEKEPRPTAIFAHGIETARLAAFAAAYAGVHVPKEMEIATFTDEPDADAGAGIRAYEIPYFEMGRRAAEMLLAKAASPQAPLPAQAVPYGFIAQERRPIALAAGM